MFQILTPLNTAVTPKAWRRKWMKVVGGKDTNEYFHTWHDSEEDADLFVSEHILSLQEKAAKEYYRPIGYAQEKLYNDRDPKGHFIEISATALAP